MSDDLNDLTTFTDRNWNGWHPDRPDTAKLEPRTPGNDHEFYLTNASDAVHEMGISKPYSFIKGTEYTVILNTGPYRKRTSSCWREAWSKHTGHIHRLPAGRA